MTEIVTNSGLAVINLKKHLTLKGARHFIKFTFARKNVFTYPFMYHECILLFEKK